MGFACCYKRVTGAHQDPPGYARPFTTRRKFAALVGLIIFMSHTLYLGLWLFFKLMRCYARVCSPSTLTATDVAWDEPLAIAESVMNPLKDACELLLQNSPAEIWPALPPSKHMEDYDTVIIVDASAAGWAAYVTSSCP